MFPTRCGAPAGSGCTQSSDARSEPPPKLFATNNSVPSGEMLKMAKTCERAVEIQVVSLPVADN